MYKRDQAAIERWCKNPDKLLDVGTMVLVSIRNQWTAVGTAMQDVRDNGTRAKSLWGWKIDGYVYLRDNRKRLYGRVRDCRAGRIEPRDLLRDFLQVPGLGLPKGGFLVQLLTGYAGCLDMHNVERFGLDSRVWNIRNLVDPADQLREIEDKITLYLGLCRDCGGSEYLWDTWCDHLADKVGTFTDGDDVSRRHYTYLTD